MSERPSRMHAHWSFAAAIVALAAVWLAMLLGGAGHLDQRIYVALYAGHRATLLTIARVFTFLGEPTLLIGASAAAALLLWRTGRGRTGLVLLAVTLTGRILSEAQKYWIARPRPGLEPHLVVVKTSSFPSGHATSSMIFYFTFALVLAGHSRRRFSAAGAAIILSLLIGTSRVMLGVHWPSDVVGGWAFGLLWVLLTLRPAERLLRINSEMA
jgi:membrane-associated phospholipid phosphatase